MIPDRYHFTGRVCDQKSASAKNQWIIPRMFHSSLITAVKDRLSPHVQAIPVSAEYIFLGIRRACLPFLPPPSSHPPPTFSMPFSAGTTTVRGLSARQWRPREAFAPRADIILFSRAISLSRHHLRSKRKV